MMEFGTGCPFGWGFDWYSKAGGEVSSGSY